MTKFFIFNERLVERAVIATLVVASLATTSLADHFFVSQNEVALPEGGASLLAFGSDEPLDFQTDGVVASGK